MLVLLEKEKPLRAPALALGTLLLCGACTTRETAFSPELHLVPVGKSETRRIMNPGTNGWVLVVALETKAALFG